MKPMKRIHRDRLRKLAGFLEDLDERRWGYGSITDIDQGEHHSNEPMTPHRCGSTACALGWAPAVFPKVATWVEGVPRWFGLRGQECDRGASEFFGLSYEEVNTIFYQAGLGDWDSDSPDPISKDNIAALLRYVARHQELPPSDWRFPQ